jgi:hypothetical protein
MKRTSHALFEGARGLTDTFTSIWINQGQPDFLTRAAADRRDNASLQSRASHGTSTPTTHNLPMSPALRKAKAAHQKHLANSGRNLRGRDVLTQLLQIESANQLGVNGFSAPSTDSHVIGQASPGTIWKSSSQHQHQQQQQERTEVANTRVEEGTSKVAGSRRKNAEATRKSSITHADDTVLFRHQIVDRDEVRGVAK